MERKREEGKFWEQPEKRLKFLVALLLSLIAFFVFLSANSPEMVTLTARLRAYKQSVESQRRFQQSLALDPKIGTSWEQLKLDFPDFSGSSPLLVVVFGGCESCGAQKLKEWAGILGEWEAIRKEVKGVLVIQDKAEKVRKVAKENGWKVKFVPDEDGEIAKALNTFFYPRAYGFSEGKLVWVQKRVGMGIGEVLEEFLTIVKGRERAVQVLNEWSAEIREKEWGKLPDLARRDRL